MMHAAVIVLGDLGRSPRMQYHARALAVNGVTVDLVGEEGTPLPTALDHPHIREHRLKPRRGVGGVPGSAVAVIRMLLRLRRPDVIVAQTPPAIPTLAAVWLVARLRRSRLIIDWHNLGWTLLPTSTPPRRWVSKVARALERASASRADAHLAVSDALAQHLRDSWGLAAVSTFHDKPADFTATPANRDDTRRHLNRLAGLPDAANPAIVLSPTSWTRDESLDMALDAADALAPRWTTDGPGDGLVLVISGQGAGRAAFEERLRRRPGHPVRIITTWVTADDYPALVAAADAGLSLHRSSSRLDLPMKICDLFGAALPVCAFDYGPTLRELVQPNQNALLFTDARMLADCLDRLFRTWPAPTAVLDTLRAGAANVAAGARWSAHWQRVAAPIILDRPTP
jgi:beta-1,4-mannosyltransferase